MEIGYYTLFMFTLQKLFTSNKNGVFQRTGYEDTLLSLSIFEYFFSISKSQVSEHGHPIDQ